MDFVNGLDNHLCTRFFNIVRLGCVHFIFSELKIFVTGRNERIVECGTAHCNSHFDDLAWINDAFVAVCWDGLYAAVCRVLVCRWGEKVKYINEKSLWDDTHKLFCYAGFFSFAKAKYTIMQIISVVPSHWKLPNGTFNQNTVASTAVNGSMLPSKLVSFAVSDCKLSI